MWGRIEMRTGFLVKKPEKRRPFGRLRRDESIILKWMIEKWNGVMYWIGLAQDRDRWGADVNAVMNLLVL